jgi:hypothetical protein
MFLPQPYRRRTQRKFTWSLVCRRLSVSRLLPSLSLSSATVSLSFCRLLCPTILTSSLSLFVTYLISVYVSGFALSLQAINEVVRGSLWLCYLPHDIHQSHATSSILVRFAFCSVVNHYFLKIGHLSFHFTLKYCLMLKA